MNISEPITIEALRVLDAIDRRGSYAAAAEEMDKVPSALSYVVQKLEDQLSVTLFQKQGRRSVLTPAGKHLLNEGRSILEAVTSLAEQTQNVARGYESKIRIAIDSVFNTQRVFDVLKTFLDKHPDIEIDVREEALNGTWEALTHDHVDLVIGATSPVPGNQGIRAVEIAQLDLAYVVSANHPLARANQPLSSTDIPKERRVVTHDTARESVAWTRGLLNSSKHFYVSSTSSKKLAQLAGIGIGYLPRNRIQRELEDGSLVEIEMSDQTPTNPVLYQAWKVVNRGKGLKLLTELISKEFNITSN